MYLVAGLGITGQSVLRYFEAIGEPCRAFDTRNSLEIAHLKSQFPQVEFALGEVPIEWVQQCTTVVLSPGISQSEPWVVALQSLGKEIVGDVELFARAVGAPVIAITGSNGKSTVTTMTGMALQAAGYRTAICGNIGEPVLDLLIDEHDYEVYVLELSSFQLETTYSLNSVSATVLNISEDHMDRYTDLEGYILAKTKVFANTECAVLPNGFNAIGLLPTTKICRFGLDESPLENDQAYGVINHVTKKNDQACSKKFKVIDETGWLGYGATPLVALAEMQLKGRHHQLNALAMMALCRPFKVSAEQFRWVLNSFGGLPHRVQLVGIFEGVAWINDSKGTNVGATLTAIESVGGQSAGPLILIAGGVGKEADFSALHSAVKHFCRHTILFGRDREKIAEALEGVAVTCVDTLSEAVTLANALAVAEESVLFSPACASFDQFEHYVQRGEIYIQLVEATQFDGADREFSETLTASKPSTTSTALTPSADEQKGVSKC